MIPLTMRVVLFGQTGPYTPPVLRYLVTRTEGAGELVFVVEGRKQPPGRGPHRLRSPNPRALPEVGQVWEIATAAGIPCLETSNVNDPWVARRIAETQPDLLLCVGFNRLFSDALLNVPRLGGINCHPSVLPDLRGPSPIFWAIRRGDRQLGVTLHVLDAREDHGPILAQGQVPIPHLASGGDLYRVAASEVIALLEPILAQAAEGDLTGQPQDHALATRAPRPRAEDAHFDPAEWRAEPLLDFVTAAPLFRTAWMRLGGDVFFVRRGVAVEIGRTLPGQYVQQGATMLVQCLDGVAHLEIQT